MKNYIQTMLALCLLCSVAYADFDVEQFKANVSVTRVTEDSSQLQTSDDPPVPLGPVVVTRSGPQKFPAAPATCVKVFPLEGKGFGDNLIARTKVTGNTAVAQLIETTPGYVIYAFTQSGTHNVSLRQIGQNPLDFAEVDITVVVGAGGTNPPPVDPPPVTGGVVRDASRRGATALNDPATATAMANALRNAITQARNQPIASQKVIIRDAVENVMLNRKGTSQQKDWLGLWREPVNAAIASQNPSVNYLSLIQQAIDGLAGGDPNRELPMITMYSIPGCGDCELFKQNELPAVTFAKIEIAGADPSVRLYPSFRISYAGRSMLVEGYRSADVLQTVINSMAVQ